VGCFLGLILSHCSIILFDSYLKESFRYSFSGWCFLNEEGYLLIVGLLIGILAGLIPALIAYKTDISKTLSQN
jgi:putative ABC transport system permease protein